MAEATPGGWPSSASLRRDPTDSRSLIERIESQIRERIEEAVDMAGLGLMVELRRRHGRAAPETSSARDREEFEAMALALLRHLRAAWHADLAEAERRALEAAEAAAATPRDGLLAGQVMLARRLPDYWERFETYRARYAEASLAATPAWRSWIRRRLGRP